MVVYLDELLLENFIVNLFLLNVTAQCMRIRVRLKFMVLAAAFGSLYVMTMLFQETEFLTIIPFQLIVAALMILISFRRKKIIFNLKCLSIFLLQAMVLSGICYYLEVNGMKSFYFPEVISYCSYKEIIIGLILSYLFIYRTIIFIQDRKDAAGFIYSVDIIFNNSTTRVRAFLDTGNELREPVTNLPVIIVQKDAFKDLNIKDSEKLYIPYSVINGGTGKLEGFKPNFIKIYYGKEKIEDKNAIVGFSEKPLSEYDDYKALLSRGIL